MKVLLMTVLLVFSLATPASAMEFSAPEAPSDISVSVPKEPETFSQGLWMVIKEASAFIRPSFTHAASICFRVLAVGLLVSVIKFIPGSPDSVVELIAVVVISEILLESSDSLIRLATATIADLSNYGKLLLPVLAAALAAQGGAATSAALYTGTVVMDTVLSSVVSSLITSVLYIYLCLSVVSNAIDQGILSKVKGYGKDLSVWLLKTVLYIFTGYLAITGVISGSADAMALKATKLTISGMVPVVGGVIADASEAILVGAGVMKSSAGIYGLLVLLGICAVPFIRIGVQYLLLKGTGCIFSIFSASKPGKILEDFTSAMGILLAMTGTVCLLFMISIVCFMKGVN